MKGGGYAECQSACGSEQDRYHSDSEGIFQAFEQYWFYRCPVVEGCAVAETARQEKGHVVDKLFKNWFVQTELSSLLQNHIRAHSFDRKWIARHDSNQHEQHEDY